MTDQHELQEIYESIVINASELMQDYDPLSVAACMLAQALSIYRTALDEEDYNRIIDNISAKRDKIQVFTNNETLH